MEIFMEIYGNIYVNICLYIYGNIYVASGNHGQHRTMYVDEGLIISSSPARV
jgi:uncharacterized protein YycO